ncbi:hypothetical protein ACF0H5_011210 [Mactra antiquata]
MNIYLIALVCIGGSTLILGLDNGLALTPPMGWLSWERFRCNIDCKKDPKNCISENLYVEMADMMVFKGYKQYGYQYVNIDDCWSEMSRDSNGTLVADRERFPRGIKWLADYVHFRGLKLGIYGDVGIKTCGGYPGSLNYYQKDAQTFAEWGVDMVKLDGCYASMSDMATGYPQMSYYLNQTGRPILYSCSWPAYQVEARIVPDYKKIASYCNIWRNYKDVQDSWDSVEDIMDFYANNSGHFAEVARPGQFNDPDMLIVGDYGLSYGQQTIQMSIWAILAAPMMISADLRNMKEESKDLLQNEMLLRISQDMYGIQGKRIIKDGNVEVWTKQMGINAKAVAFAFLNVGTDGTPVEVSYQFSRLGLTEAEGYNVTNVLEEKFFGVLRPTDYVNVTVYPTSAWLGYADFDC